MPNLHWEYTELPWGTAFRGMARGSIRYLDTTPATHRPGSSAFRGNWRFTTPNRVISGTARSGITITLLCPKVISRIGCARRRMCCKAGMRSYLSTTFRTDLCSERLQAAGFNSGLWEHVWAAASRVGALGGAQRVDAHRVLYAQSPREIRRTATGYGVSRHGSQRDPIFGHFGLPWRASRPANMASPRRARPRPADC